MQRLHIALELAILIVPVNRCEDLETPELVLEPAPLVLKTILSGRHHVSLEGRA